MRLRKPIAKLLAQERVCRVATTGRDRLPHVVPVCHVVADGNIYFASGSDSKKVQNLKAHPHATVLVDVYSEDWDLLRGVAVRGTTRLIQRGPQFRKVRALLYRKYPQYASEAPLEESDSVIVEMTPVQLSSWGFE